MMNGDLDGFSVVRLQDHESYRYSEGKSHEERRVILDQGNQRDNDSSENEHSRGEDGGFIVDGFGSVKEDNPG